MDELVTGKSVEQHEEKETIVVDVTIPMHDERETTSLFTRTREQVLKEVGNKCEITGQPESEVGPLELHHFWVERCLANAVDIERLHNFLRLMNTKSQKAIDWIENELKTKQYKDIDIMEFTDNMEVNGLALSKRLHTGKGEGIHFLPFPFYQLWAIGKVGFKFIGNDVIVDENLES